MTTFALGSGLAASRRRRSAPICWRSIRAMRLQNLVYFLIVVAVGGLGSIRGPFVAALLLGIADTAFQIPAAGIRRVLHLCADDGDPAVAAARPVRPRMMRRSPRGRRRLPGGTATTRSKRCRGWSAVAAYFVFPDYLALGRADPGDDPLRAVGRSGARLRRDRHPGARRVLRHRRLHRRDPRRQGWGEPITGLLAGAVAAALLGVLVRPHHPAHDRPDLADADPGRRRAAGRSGQQGLAALPAATTGCRAWRCGRSSAGSASTCSAAPPTSIASSCCFCAGWSARQIVHSPFGRSLTGIRENVRRMHAIGAPVAAPALVDLHDLGGARRRLRRADRADDAIRRPQLSRPRALRHRADHADHRRRRAALRRLHRRAALHDRAGPLLRRSTRSTGISGSGC